MSAPSPWCEHSPGAGPQRRRRDRQRPLGLVLVLLARRGAYAAAKAAAWSLTNSIRLELAAQGTHVTGVHSGAVDTDFSANYDGPKIDPADVVRATLDGLASDAVEVLVDEWSTDIKASWPVTRATSTPGCPQPEGDARGSPSHARASAVLWARLAAISSSSIPGCGSGSRCGGRVGRARGAFAPLPPRRCPHSGSRHTAAGRRSCGCSVRRRTDAG
ncbi:SDR family NAD(P)-dependent oxidoreductase [Micromonospora sp. M12]